VLTRRACESSGVPPVSLVDLDVQVLTALDRDDSACRQTRGARRAVVDRERTVPGHVTPAGLVR
jgi:hypothetical protein